MDRIVQDFGRGKRGIGEVCHEVIGAAMTVHSRLGEVFLEEVYKNALVHKLGKRGVA